MLGGLCVSDMLRRVNRRHSEMGVMRFGFMNMFLGFCRRKKPLFIFMTPFCKRLTRKRAQTYTATFLGANLQRPPLSLFLPNSL